MRIDLLGSLEGGEGGGKKDPPKLSHMASRGRKSCKSSNDVESPHSQRDPFWAFVHQIDRWVRNVVTHEAQDLVDGVVGAPSFMQHFLRDTSLFYRKNPKVLYKEIISGFPVAIIQVP